MHHMSVTGTKRTGFFRIANIQTKMLLIIAPLIVVPMLVLAVVGFLAASGEAAKTSSRYFKQRENDLRTLTENLPVRDYYFNQFYGLTDEAEVYRRELERALKRFADRSNSSELIYTRARYVDARGREVIKILYAPEGADNPSGSARLSGVVGTISSDRRAVTRTPFFTAVADTGPGEVFRSPIAPTMVYAMPVYRRVDGASAGQFLGAVVLDFINPLQDFQHTRGVITLWFALLTVVSLGIALFLTLNCVRRLTHPIRRLAEAANRIATGERPVAVEYEVNDEIGILAQSFNQMAQGLARHEAVLQRKVTETTALAHENARLYEQVRQYTEALEAKVSERTRELQAANLKLEAASRHKSEFLANMSHELRTPMNAIIGFTRLVMRRSREALAPRQYGNLEKILISANHLLSLINNVLDLSKIEAGRIEVYPAECALGPLVEECLHTVEPIVDRDRVQLVQEIEAGLPKLFTDRDKVKQILMNLLSNAVKFTHCGTIAVTARSHDGTVSLTVRDSGIGIPQEALAHIFEEFRQVDSSTTREYGGTGLGLAISRHLAHLMGGEITVQSRPGEGSAFTLTLPKRYTSVPAEGNEQVSRAEPEEG